MKELAISFLVFTAFALPFAAGAAEQPAESGRWITESGNLEVEIAPCGDAICGTVVRVIANRSMSRSGEDMAAADRQSPQGMKILSDFRKTGGAEWQGRIYNRENAETYDCLMELVAPDQLKIHAYKGIPLFGKTQLWRRAAAAEVQGAQQEAQQGARQ